MRNLILIAFLLFVVVTAVYYILPSKSPTEFITGAFAQLDGGEGDEWMESTNLPSGERYQFILEHSCCSGAGFDAVAIKTSNDQKFYSYKNYCGIGAFYESVPYKINNLEEFTEFLKNEGYSKY